MSHICTWCGTAYQPRGNGGRPQRFCAAPCRRDFETACRIWAAQEYEAERLSIFTLRTALYQRARSLQRDLASEGQESGTARYAPSPRHKGKRVLPRAEVARDSNDRNLTKPDIQQATQEAVRRAPRISVTRLHQQRR